MYFSLPTLMGTGSYSLVVEIWTRWLNECSCQVVCNTCDVDGNYVCWHSLGCLPHLLLWGGEGCGLVPYHLSVNFRPLLFSPPSLRGLGPHGELRFVVLQWRSCGLERREEKGLIRRKTWIKRQEWRKEKKNREWKESGGSKGDGNRRDNRIRNEKEKWQVIETIWDERESKMQRGKKRRGRKKSQRWAIWNMTGG